MILDWRFQECIIFSAPVASEETKLTGVLSLSVKNMITSVHTPLGYENRCALASHRLDLSHQVLFPDTEILLRTTSWRECLLQKSLEICLKESVLNREDGLRC